MTNYWENRLSNIQRFWTDDKCALWKESFDGGDYIISPGTIREFLLWVNDNSNWYSQILAIAEKTLTGRISIFEEEYDLMESGDGLPWNKDWRFDHVWETGKGSYQFYKSEKSSPYDVKFPWELSRMGFLIPVGELALVSDDTKWKDYCVSSIQDWSEQNPVAKSVNWYPMECSIRIINLGFVFLLLAGSPSIKPVDLMKIVEMITIHAEYIFKKIEYSDIRGNHYLANIVALLFAGHLLKDVYPPANKWFAYAQDRFEGEILLQILPDGVNFEKSVPYHRLVTELCFLGLAVLDKEKYTVCEEARYRIELAIQFIRAYIRPDGLAPNIGDNDSARIFNFDPFQIRDHSTILSLGTAYFSEPNILENMRLSSAPPLLFGATGVSANVKERIPNTADGAYDQFPVGGFFIAKNDRHYLFADYGEVGLKGRGGHGHNDLFSFELCIDKKPIVIDPGTPTYTGDLDTHLQYRSTYSHNAVRVDEIEMADFLGHWRISNEADPSSVEKHIQGSMVIIQGEHYGYAKLDDPVMHKRKLQFNIASGDLICDDNLKCNSSHTIERILHLNHDLGVTLEDQLIRIIFNDQDIGFLECSDADRIDLDTFYQSNAYGQTILSNKIILKNDIHSSRKLVFRISPSLARS